MRTSRRTICYDLFLITYNYHSLLNHSATQHLSTCEYIVRYFFLLYSMRIYDAHHNRIKMPIYKVSTAQDHLFKMLIIGENRKS